MASVPAQVAAYLTQICITARAPAFLRVAADGRIAELGGELQRYGLTALVGQSLAEPWLFLKDFLVFDEESLDLPFIQVGAGVLVDLHFLRSDEGTWIIILDASALEERQRRVQQQAHELSLQQRSQQKLLRQYVGAGVAEKLPSWDPTSEGERRELTVMFADLCGFTPYCEARSPGQVFRTLNAYLGAMIEPIVASGGFVDKLIGDEVMALFGLLPVAGDQAVHAVHAAAQLMQEVRARYERADLEVALKVSIGIATGPVAVGVLGTRERRSFTVIGHHVNLAARLESQARPGELLIDAATHSRLGSQQALFEPRKLLLKGMATPLAAFSLVPD